MIRYLLLLLLGVPLTLLFSSLAVLGGAVGARHGYYDWIHRTWSGGLLRLAGIRVVTEGLEHLDPDGPQVIVANHQSLFDILALFRTLPVSLRFVAKKELGGIPVFSEAMRRAGHVFIDRGDRAQAVRVMQRAGERMKREGLVLGLFPEGTRSVDGRLRPFKKGAFVLAIDLGTPLVPVAVQGGSEILPKGRRALRPRTLYIRCAPPLDLSSRSREDRDRVLRATREAVASMLEELATRPPHPPARRA